MIKKWIVLFLFISLLFVPSRRYSQEYEEKMGWKVKIGDKKTYEIKKYIIKGEEEVKTEIQTEDGSNVNVTVKKGLKITIEIIRLNNTIYAFGKVIYGNVISEEQELVPFIRPTTDNKTYWEEWEISGSEMNDEYTFYIRKVEGDLTIEEGSYQFDDISVSSRTVRNWKSGWLVSLYMRVERLTIDEILLEEIGKENLLFKPIDIPQPINLLIIFCIALGGGMGLGYLYERMIKSN